MLVTISHSVAGEINFFYYQKKKKKQGRFLYIMYWSYMCEINSSPTWKWFGGSLVGKYIQLFLATSSITISFLVTHLSKAYQNCLELSPFPTPPKPHYIKDSQGRPKCSHTRTQEKYLHSYSRSWFISL
jgi:hypothetical protein